ncbi:MAG: sulfate reduction electron transfer complex DsrMKJOP subunit DsrO [Bryobacteraceae bacterium]|jgi:molybdopterin-containing oxidoreductase family iron-sulfur binding subunit
MNITRKGFLRITGFSLVAVTARRFLGAIGERVAPARKARRWAMVVDIGKCLQKEGCIKCIAACNKAHNIPVFQDRRREIVWIWKAQFENVLGSEGGYTPGALRGQPIPVLCNHCDDPPCTRVCPTQATWKREDGIVMMDWHRCIGCRYCIAACPYGSRSFNWSDPRPHIAELNPDFPTRTTGVVEKCNFCEERLASGRPPACVEACPEKALVFGDLNDAGSPVRELLRSRYATRRKSELGTRPSIFYIV